MPSAFNLNGVVLHRPRGAGRLPRRGGVRGHRLPLCRKPCRPATGWRRAIPACAFVTLNAGATPDDGQTPAGPVRPLTPTPAAPSAQGRAAAAPPAREEPLGPAECPQPRSGHRPAPRLPIGGDGGARGARSTRSPPGRGQQLEAYAARARPAGQSPVRRRLPLEHRLLALHPRRAPRRGRPRRTLGREGQDRVRPVGRRRPGCEPNAAPGLFYFNS